MTGDGEEGSDSNNGDTVPSSQGCDVSERWEPVLFTRLRRRERVRAGVARPAALPSTDKMMSCRPLGRQYTRPRRVNP